MPSIRSIVEPFRKGFDAKLMSTRLYEAFVEVETRIAAIAGGGSGAQDYARVYGSAAQSIPNNTLTALVFDKTRAQEGGLHSDSSQNTRITIFTAGLYFISGHVQFAAHATGVRKVQIQLSGATILASQEAINLNATDLDISVSTGYNLSVGDYIEIMVYQNSGAALNVNAVPNYSPEGFVSQV